MKTRKRITALLLGLFLSSFLIGNAQISEDTPETNKENTLIEYPKSTLGLIGGVNLSNDFDQTDWCVGAEYRYKICSIGEKPIYAGAEVLYKSSDFMSFNSNAFMGGLKAEKLCPISTHGDTQFVTGLKANYFTGTEDNSGFETKFDGYSAGAYLGLNINVCENWFLGAEVDLFTIGNTTYEPDFGLEYERKDKSFSFGKGMFSLRLRRGF